MAIPQSAVRSLRRAGLLILLALACGDNRPAVAPSEGGTDDSSPNAGDDVGDDTGAGTGADAADAGLSLGAAPYACARDSSDFCLTDPPFLGVWQSGPDDVWLLVSDFQEVSLHHWDGAAWTAHDTGAAALSAIWGSASNDIWAVGPAGSIVHWDGSQFTASASGTDAALVAVWGSGAGDVWAVGTTSDAPARATTLHWDGAAWSTVDCCQADPTASFALRAVGGSGAHDVWAVGERVAVADATRSPYALHWDGAGWSPVDVASSGAGFGLTAVWADRPGDVWLGAETQILHFDGQAFATSKDGIIGAIAAIWGSGPDDVWAVRPRGGVQHWDGTAWNSALSGTVNDLGGVFGSGAADAWAVGPQGSVLHFDGNAWTPIADGAQGPLDALWGTSDSDLWTTGPLHWDGGRWVADQTDSAIPALDLCGFAGGDVWAVGVNLQQDLDVGYVARFSAGAWTIEGVDGIYAAYTGLDPTLGPSSLRALFCNTPSDVWAVGQFQGIVGDVVATIVHWDGNLWSPVAAPSSWDLNGVWGSGAGDIWAAGSSGTLMHWDGGAWSAVPSGTTANLGAIWGSAADDVWVIVEAQAQLLHWDGTQWSFVPSGTTNPHLARLWGRGQNDVWAVGGDATGGVVVHWDGAAWSTVWNAPAAVGGLTAVWGSAATLWVVASGGLVFSHPHP